MNKLLSANFSRLWRDKFFWLGTAALIIFSAIYFYTPGAEGMTPGVNFILYEIYSIVMIFLSGYCALFISLYIGTEYGDGTIRNKIIAGHKRCVIYFANLITVFAAALIIFALCFIVLILIPYLKAQRMNFDGLVIHIAVCAFILLEFSALFTLSSMLIKNRAITVVVSVILFFGMMFASSAIYSRLNQQEFNGGYVITTVNPDGSVTMDQSDDQTPNPEYLSEEERPVYEFLFEALPSGQLIMLNNEADKIHPVKIGLTAAVFASLLTAAGLVIFNRKNLY